MVSCYSCEFVQWVLSTPLDGCRQHPYKHEQCADRKCPRIRVLGTTVRPQGKEPGDKEIQRRIMAGWAAYAKHWDIFKGNLAICLKRQVYNSCVLPAMTYSAETKRALNKLAAAHTKMERSMLNITCAKIEDQHLGQGEDKSHRYNQH